MTPTARKRVEAAPPPRRRGRPLDHDSRETRAAILASALAHFGRASYTDVSLVKIASDCDLDKRAIYHHFPSKRALFEAAREEAFSRFILEFKTTVLAHETAPGRFGGYFDVYRNLYASDPAVLNTIAMSVLDDMGVEEYSDSLLQAGIELLGMIEKVIDDGIAAGEIRADLDRQGVVEMFSAISMGLSLLSLAASPHFPMMIDAVDRLASGTFFAPPAPPKRKRAPRPAKPGEAKTR